MSVQSYIRKDVSGMLHHIDVGVFLCPIPIGLSSTSTEKLQRFLSDDTGLDGFMCIASGRCVML